MNADCREKPPTPRGQLVKLLTELNRQMLLDLDKPASKRAVAGMERAKAAKRAKR